MLRRFFTVLSALSLLLCTGTCALWARSFSVVDYLYHSTRHRYENEVSRGVLVRQGVLQCDIVRHPLLQGAEFDSGLVNYRRGPWDWGHMDVATKGGPDHLKALAHLGCSVGWRDPPSQVLQFGSGKRVYSHSRGNIGVKIPPDTTAQVVTLPLWAIGLLTAALPVGNLGKSMVAGYRRRWKARRSGRCKKCGYDLRATPGRCPECGAVPAKPL
jgi:hypothetical protein